MKLAALNSNPIVPAKGLTIRREVPVSAYGLDEVQLNGAIDGASQKVQELSLKRRDGQRLAVAGSGVALAGFTALIAAQTLVLGDVAKATLLPVAAATMGGVGVFASGIWRRDSADMEVYWAKADLEHLEKVRESRFGHANSAGTADNQQFMAILDAQEQLWRSQSQVRQLRHNEENGNLWGRLGVGIGLGSLVAGLGNVMATHGNGSTGFLVAMGVTHLAGGAVWLAGNAMKEKAALAVPAAQASVAECQKRLDQLQG